MLFGKDISIKKRGEASLHSGLEEYDSDILLLVRFCECSDEMIDVRLRRAVDRYGKSRRLAAHGGYVNHNSWLVDFEE
jgi:hypothetical protein